MYETLVSLQRLILNPKSDGVMLVGVPIIFLNDRFQNAHVVVTILYAEVSQEKTERRHPSKKKIYLSGTSKIKLQTCLLIIALDSRVNLK